MVMFLSCCFKLFFRYYCDYCDIHLTSNAMNVRKTHNDGKHHKENVKHHYKAVMQENAQKIINRTIQDAEATHMAPNILSHDVMFYPLMNVNNPFMISTPNFAPFINFPPPCCKSLVYFTDCWLVLFICFIFNDTIQLLFALCCIDNLLPVPFLRWENADMTISYPIQISRRKSSGRTTFFI